MKSILLRKCSLVSLLIYLEIQDTICPHAFVEHFDIPIHVAGRPFQTKTDAELAEEERKEKARRARHLDMAVRYNGCDDVPPRRSSKHPG